MLVALTGNVAKVVNRKRGGRVGTHVQLLNAEIDAVGSCLYGSHQRLAGADGRHDFIFRIHNRD